MLFPVQDRLVKMGDAPSLGDVVLEQLGELFGSFSRDIVSPGAERHQEIVILVKCHISVHHPADSQRFQAGQCDAVALFYVLCQIAVASLKPFPDLIQGIGPDAVHIAVLPIIAPGSQGLVVLPDQDCLDPGRTKLDAEGCLALFHQTFCCVFFHVASSHSSCLFLLTAGV